MAVKTNFEKILPILNEFYKTEEVSFYPENEHNAGIIAGVVDEAQKDPKLNLEDEVMVATWLSYPDKEIAQKVTKKIVSAVS